MKLTLTALALGLTVAASTSFLSTDAFARRGADDPAGHVRGGQGADDPAGHVRRGRGADDPAGDDRGGRKGGKGRGADDGANHR